MQNPGATKRQKERVRQDKQREKDARKAERKRDDRQPAHAAAPGVDPDIAGIVPGPQPVME